ncbi:MAG: AAA family ATPase [Isosphaeraceae bacterium]
MTEELKDLLEKVSALGSSPVVLTVPGPSDTLNPARKPVETVLEMLESDNYSLEFMRQLLSNQQHFGRDFREGIVAAFKPFEEWSCKTAQAKPEQFKNGEFPGDFTATIALGKQYIGVAGLNTEIIQLPLRYVARGSFMLIPHQFERACRRNPDAWAAKHDLCVLLTHRAPSWLHPESRWAFYGEVVPPSRFALHLCSRVEEDDPLCVQDGPTLLVQAPPFRAEGAESGYIAGTISLRPGPVPVTLRPRRYNANPRAKFVPDPSYSPEPIATYQRSLRRMKDPMTSGTLPQLSEKSDIATLRVRFLEIQNFRCLKRLSIDFQRPSRLPGYWTCLAGINGAGKTSVLQALAVVLLGEPLARDLGSARLTRLRRVSQGIRQETCLRAWIQLEARQSYIELNYGHEDATATQSGTVYPQALLKLWERLRSEVILAYGATRSLSDFIDTRYHHLSPDVRRVMTLFDPLSQVSSAESLLGRHKTAKTPLLRLVKPLLRQVFGDDLGVSVRDGRVVFTARDGPVEAIDLPDGFRSSIAWLADLCAAWCEKFPKRAAKGDPSDIEALVLIDEIDLHLHPSLQRTLVPRLREALPHVQWVVTTHSPLILSCFDSAEIVALDRDEPGGVRFLDRQILGFTTDQIYEWLMGTTPTGAVMEQELTRNGTPGVHSEKELAELLMMSPEVSADEAKDRARQLRERVERLGR